MNLENLKDWKKAWQELETQSQIHLEQARLVLPTIEQKIIELEAQEVKNGE